MLQYERTKPVRQKTYDVRVYRCKNKECPVRWECSRDKKGKTVEIGPYHDAVQRQRDKQASPANRAKLKKRGAIVERTFAHIKQAMGFRRWTVHGLGGVKAQWALICTAYNLQILYKAWLNKTPPKKNISFAAQIPPTSPLPVRFYLHLGAIFT